MPNMTLQQVAKTIACTVTTTTTSPLDTYSAWATALGVSDEITELDDDFWAFRYTMGAPFFPGRDDYKQFWLSTEGAIGLYYEYTTTSTVRGLELPFNAVVNPVARSYQTPIICLAFRTDENHYMRDVRIQVTANATIFYGKLGKYDPYPTIIDQYIFAGKIESGKITLVGKALVDDVMVYLHEVQEGYTNYANTTYTKQSLSLDTQDTDSIRTYVLELAKSISGVIYDETGAPCARTVRVYYRSDGSLIE